jgi:hypothetical protein
MMETRRRGALAGAFAVGGAALIGIGFWIGQTNPGSTVHPDILQGTVTHLGGATQVDEFAVDLDADAGSKSYGLGPVPWTRGPGHGVTLGGTTPPCVAVGHHITFGVVHVRVSGFTTDQIVWIDCGDIVG